MENRTYVRPFQYFTDTDRRIHFDYEKFGEVKKQIVELSDDKCPTCGGTENLCRCRCFDDHRYCPCGTQWQWYVDRHEGVVKLRINKTGKINA